MWRWYRLLVGLITCHPIAKLGGYMVTFGTISAISYTGATIFTRSDSAYAGIIFLMLVPASFFGGLALIPLGVYLAFKKACIADPSLRSKSLGEILKQLSGEQDVRNRIIVFILFSIANVVLSLVIDGRIRIYGLSQFLWASLPQGDGTGVRCTNGRRTRAWRVDRHIGPGASWFVRLQDIWAAPSLCSDGRTQPADS
jgi:hypothetical protein